MYTACREIVRSCYAQVQISEIADYLQDLEDCSEEDLNDIEVAILPPDEVDEVTDIEEGPDDEMGVIPVSDVAGQVEFSCTIDQTVYKRSAVATTAIRDAGFEVLEHPSCVFTTHCL
ncbi:hypothetical protein EVAR_20608_1 [Eumeta japonica]|uniref:Uncharacterized protein n=1 Tax=Eumeta variegata TaxID=151549 RepID=A0A4C1US14_EUMVA|nr:hypothetical protein EVAR_20608_1 [Eumeta japonica]